MRLRFLGTADSEGIPVHACQCEVCETYRERKEVNLSTCAVIESDEGVIFLDAGIESIATDFDGQEILGVCLTHFHSDHCLALLRLRYSKQKIHCYHPKDPYGFSNLFKYPYAIEYNRVNAFEPFEIANCKFTPIPLKHSKNTLGYVIETQNKTIAYLTDCAGIKPKAMETLKKFTFDYVFIDACYDERKTEGNHLNYLQASEILDELDIQEGYLMHNSHITQAYIQENEVVLKYPYINKGANFSL